MAFALLVRNLYTESAAWFRHHHNMAMGYRTSVYHVVALGTGDGGGTTSNPHYLRVTSNKEYKTPSQYKNGLSTYRDFHYKDKTVVSL